MQDLYTVVNSFPFQY